MRKHFEFNFTMKPVEIAHLSIILLNLIACIFNPLNFNIIYFRFIAALYLIGFATSMIFDMEQRSNNE